MKLADSSSVSSLPDVDGWLHLVDKYRADMEMTEMSCKAPSDMKSLKTLLTRVRSSRKHALLVITHAQEHTCYLVKLSPGNYTDGSSFANAADFNTHLYIDQSWTKKQLNAPTIDPDSACVCAASFTPSLCARFSARSA